MRLEDFIALRNEVHKHVASGTKIATLEVGPLWQLILEHQQMLDKIVAKVLSE